MTKWIATYYNAKGYASEIEIDTDDIGTKSPKEWAELCKSDGEWYTLFKKRRRGQKSKHWRD